MEVRIIAILAVITCIYVNSVNTLVGYDCSHKNTEGVSISTYGLTECVDFQNAPNKTLQYIQVLSIKKHEPIEYTQCLVTRSSLIYKCGGFDHVMLLPNSLTIEETIEVTPEQCSLMVETGRYHTPPGAIVEGISMGKMTNFQTVDAGMSTPDGKCEGVTLIHHGVTYHKAVKVSHYKITLQTGTARRVLSVNEVLFPDGCKCKYARGSCYEGQHGRRSWTVKEDKKPCGEMRYDKLYEGWANESISSTAPIIVTVESKKINFAIAVKYRSTVCGHQGYVTDDDNIIIITGRPGELPFHEGSVDTYDYNPFFDTNLKFVFLERNIANRTNDLYSYFIRQYCELNKARLRHLLSLARTNPEEFAWVYTESPGYTAITRGEAVHLIKCQAVEVSPRHLEECYNDLPVTYNNASWFLKPGSRLLVRYGRPITCSSMTPVLYSLGESWVKIGGEAYLANSPMRLSPNPDDIWKYGDITTLQSIGFLSHDQLERYRDAIVGPSEQEAVSNIFTSRVTSRGSVSSQGLSFNDGINTEKIIEQVSDSVISKLYGYWDFIAKHLGAILGFSILWNIICYVWRFTLNSILMVEQYGVKGIIVAACSSSLAKHLMYSNHRWCEKYRRKNEGDTKKETEEETRLCQIRVNDEIDNTIGQDTDPSVLYPNLKNICPT